MNLPMKMIYDRISTNSGHSPILLTAALFAASALSSTLWAATLQGTTFLDENNNSRQEPTEPILSNKTTTIFLRHNPSADAGEGGFYTTETTNGNYSFILHETGSYTLWSSMDFGWVQTLPARGEGIAFYDFTVSDGEQTITIDFGFFQPNNANNTTSASPTPPTPSEPSTPSEPIPSQPDENSTTNSDITPDWSGTLQGTLFLDDNQNGLKNQSESPLANQTVFLRENAAADAGEGGFYTTETDNNGNYLFHIHNTGTYTLWNDIPIGWQQTAPIYGEGIAFYDFTVSQSDNTVTIDLGLFQPTADNAPPVTPEEPKENTPPAPLPTDNTPSTDQDTIFLDISQATPATCQLYGITQDVANHRVIFTYNPKTDQVSPITNVTELGQMPAMTAHPDTDILYYVALSTLHQLDAQTGQRIEIGPTGLDNIISLTFDSDGLLWAWAADLGLVQLDTNTGQGTLVLPTQLTLKGMTSNLAGTVLYGLIGTELWRYEPATNEIAKLCTNLPPKTQTIKVLPETLLPEGLILLGLNQEQTVNLNVFDINTCQPVANKDITMPYQLHRLGEFTVPMAACRQ